MGLLCWWQLTGGRLKAMTTNRFPLRRTTLVMMYLQGFSTEAEAIELANSLINGGIIQQQNGVWHVWQINWVSRNPTSKGWGFFLSIDIKLCLNKLAPGSKGSGVFYYPYCLNKRLLYNRFSCLNTHYVYKYVSCLNKCVVLQWGGLFKQVGCLYKVSHFNLC